MTRPSRSEFVAPPAALAGLAALLLAAGCSAPPDPGAVDDGVPEFGTFQPPPAAGAPGTPGTANTPNAPSNPVTPPATGTGGAPSEQTANGGIGLQPAPSGNPNGAQSGNPSGAQNQGGGGAQSQGAGGSTMVGTDPDEAAGGSSADPASGSAGGATSMPPADDGNPQPPPQQPPPSDANQQPPPQQPPPSDANQQPPPQQPPPPELPPPPSGDCNGAFFCDGFESVAPGASPTAAIWRVIQGFNVTDASEKVTVSSANARTGTQSLRITEDGGRTGVLATLPQSSYFVRAFFQLDAAPLGTVFIGGGTSENDETRFRIQGQSYATINSVGSVNDPVRPADANSGNGCPDCFTLPTNEWFCAELAIDNAASTATLFINGTEVAVAGPDAFATQPPQPLLFIGSWGLQGGATGVFIDDVAVGPERFGCN